MHDADPDPSTFKMCAYLELDRSVVAVAATPTARLGKIGMPVSWPLVENW